MTERSKNSTYEYAHYVKAAPAPESVPCPEVVPLAPNHVQEISQEEETVPVGIAV